MMYEKSFWEKLGDQLAHPGKRFLLGLLSCLFLGPFGVFIALAFLESNKSFFVTNITVQTSTGEVVPCAIVKQKGYAYMPVVPFFSLFLYLPYKTDYFLLKNVSAPELQKETRVNGTLLNVGLVRMEQLTKAKAIAIQNNPQIISQELSGQAEQAKIDFFKEAKPYFDTKLLEEIFTANHLCLCDLEGMCILFHYSKVDGHFCGMHINRDYVERIKQDPSFLLATYLCMDPDKLVNNLVILNDAFLERLLRIQKENSDKNDASTNTESSEVLSRVNQNKKVLTKAIIEQTLNRSSSKPKKALGIILCLLALGAIELAIAGFVTGLFVMGIICLPLGIWLWYIAIKKIRQGKKNKENAMRGQYKIVQATCISSTKVVHEDEDGTTVFYTTKFSNGESQTLNYSLGVEGDTFYLVYLPESKKVNAIFNGIEYVPSADLLIEK